MNNIVFRREWPPKDTLGNYSMRHAACWCFDCWAMDWALGALVHPVTRESRTDVVEVSPEASTCMQHVRPRSDLQIRISYLEFAARRRCLQIIKVYGSNQEKKHCQYRHEQHVIQGLGILQLPSRFKEKLRKFHTITRSVVCVTCKPLSNIQGRSLVLAFAQFCSEPQI